MPSHFGPASFFLGKRGEVIGSPKIRPLCGVDDVKSGIFVVRDQQPVAVADRLDARGLDHRVDFPVVKERGRQRDRFQPKFIGQREGRPKADHTQ